MTAVLYYFQACSNPVSSLKYAQLFVFLVHSMETIARIEETIQSNKIVLFMKGSPNLPMCGFSARAAEALKACGAAFNHVDVLQNPDIRAELPKYANWPTFPQLWVKGELVGGCDIIMEMFEAGELQELIDSAA